MYLYITMFYAYSYIDNLSIVQHLQYGKISKKCIINNVNKDIGYSIMGN